MLKQVLKTVRTSVCKYLYSQTRHAHAHVPFSGPPSYATVNRRFNSHPNPVTYFSHKKAKEDIANGKFVDIHDIGAVGSAEFDILLTDITEKTLRTAVAELTGISYLQDASSENEANLRVEHGSGFLYGPNFRPIFPCIVKNKKGNAKWVFFVVDSGSPATYLSATTSAALGISEYLTSVTIAGYGHLARISPENSHFSDVNLLGGDFCSVHKLALTYGDEGKFTVAFNYGTSWELKRKV